MSSHAHYSKATLGGHPIHAMIIGLPIALYTTGIVALIVYAVRHDPFWYRASMTLVLAGVATALLAAVFGAIDLFFGIPRATRPRKTGVKHFGLQLLATILFAGAGFMMLGDWVGTPPAPAHLRVAAPLVIGLAGFVAMSVGAWLGWKMVQVEHVGVDITKVEAERANAAHPRASVERQHASPNR
ncbi:MAG TPA: DUF2231 domain-containing protein [Kofleriaceae bacterium]|nr:DUF2231 domain-containing protein [Kofleriaceae bacterium]